MKIILFSACLFITAGAAAQTASATTSGDYATATLPSFATPPLPDSGYSKPASLNNVNTRAIRDFIRRFNDPAGARWRILPNGHLLALFNEPDVTYHVSYTRNGGWIYTLRYYHEKKLPHDIRHMVKSVYYDYTITGVYQVEQYNLPDTVYVVYLEDASGYSRLRISEGEMELMDHMEKHLPR